MMFATYLQGAGIGIGLIAAVGAQNAFVLSQGLKRAHPGTLLAICVLCDGIFIILGIAGLGTLIAGSDILLSIARYGGAAFLIVYGFLAARRALTPGASLKAAEKGNLSRKGAVMTTLAVTLLNPHFYLDTVVLLGAIGGQIPADVRAYFAAGAVSASAIWFLCLTYGAAKVAPYVARPVTWRLIDAMTALVMGWIAFGLLWG